MSTSSSKGCTQFSIKEIEEATNHFESSKFLGQGGEAKVYFAEINIGSNRTPVAVKQLKDNSSEEFEKEIHTLSKIQHPNLVSLIGYCDESGHKILVYEYMAKGCLSDYLKKKNPIPLSWRHRLNICLGVARGLQYLHSESDEFPKGIIHRDVKPGNVLVGEGWIGKVSDFGLFKLSTAGQDESAMTTALKGTSGYYAPEYIKFRRITRKIDVYAFGVVLFEVLCRKMPWDREDESYYHDEKEDIGLWAEKNVDAEIKGEISRDSLKVFTSIIGRSLQADPGKRLTMNHVVLDLQKATECQDSKNTMPARIPRPFSVEEILVATNHFDSSKIISHGEAANVYLADICIDENKTQIVVKQLKVKYNTFEAEINMLYNIQHPNIVSMLGYCCESDYQILVYEQMPNGSLSDYLKEITSTSKLLNICLGAARGLQHLHTETDEFPNGIIHGDVKPGNILVDDNSEGKISDIGMIELSDAREGKSTRSKKVDVYAFGMVLFEVLSGSTPREMQNAMHYVVRYDHKMALWAIQASVNSQVKVEMSDKSLKIVTKMICKSLQGNKETTMDSVVLDLQKALECIDVTSAS